MTTLTLILLIIAAIAFAGAVLDLDTRVDLVALGLLAVTLTWLVPRL